jgi:hypothetical protein
VRTADTKRLAVIAGSAIVCAGAIVGATLSGASGAMAAGSSEMSTGVTVTATAPAPTPAVPMAVPDLKGPAPLPPEEQGLPG